MAKFDKILFFEKEYEQEFKTKDNVNSSLTNILTLLTINLTILSYFIINTPISLYNNSEHKLAFVFFLIFLFCYLIYFIYTLMNLYNFYFSNNEYMKIPYADKLDNYFNDLKAFDSANFENNVNKYLLDFYIKATKHNAEVNEYKNGLQFEIRKFLFIKFFILFLTFIPYYIIMEGKLNIYNVKIENKDTNYVR